MVGLECELLGRQRRRLYFASFSFHEDLLLVSVGSVELDISFYDGSDVLSYKNKFYLRTKYESSMMFSIYDLVRKPIINLEKSKPIYFRNFIFLSKPP